MKLKIVLIFAILNIITKEIKKTELYDLFLNDTEFLKRCYQKDFIDANQVNEDLNKINFLKYETIFKLIIQNCKENSGKTNLNYHYSKDMLDFITEYNENNYMNFISIMESLNALNICQDYLSNFGELLETRLNKNYNYITDYQENKLNFLKNLVNDDSKQKTFLNGEYKTTYSDFFLYHNPNRYENVKKSKGILQRAEIQNYHFKLILKKLNTKMFIIVDFITNFFKNELKNNKEDKKFTNIMNEYLLTLSKTTVAYYDLLAKNEIIRNNDYFNLEISKIFYINPNYYNKFLINLESSYNESKGENYEEFLANFEKDLENSMYNRLQEEFKKNNLNNNNSSVEDQFFDVDFKSVFKVKYYLGEINKEILKLFLRESYNKSLVEKILNLIENKLLGNYINIEFKKEELGNPIEYVDIRTFEKDNFEKINNLLQYNEISADINKIYNSMDKLTPIEINNLVLLSVVVHSHNVQDFKKLSIDKNSKEFFNKFIMKLDNMLNLSNEILQVDDNTNNNNILMLNYFDKIINFDVLFSECDTKVFNINKLEASLKNKDLLEANVKEELFNIINSKYDEFKSIKIPIFYDDIFCMFN